MSSKLKSIANILLLAVLLVGCSAKADEKGKEDKQDTAAPEAPIAVQGAMDVEISEF